MSLEYPEHMTDKERKQFLKIWKSCIPKFQNTTYNLPIIYGTGGEK